MEKTGKAFQVAEEHVLLEEQEDIQAGTQGTLQDYGMSQSIWALKKIP